MNTKDQRLLTLFLFLIIGFIAYILYNSVLKNDTEGLNLIYYFSAYTSVFGLIVTYFQITSVRRQTRGLNEAKRIEQRRISNLLYISDLARGIKLIDEAQTYLRLSKPEITHLKLKEIKSILLNAENLLDLNNLTVVRNYSKIKVKLTSDILNLDELLLKKKPTIDFAIINANLEVITNLFMSFDGRLKNM